MLRREYLKIIHVYGEMDEVTKELENLKEEYKDYDSLKIEPLGHGFSDICLYGYKEETEEEKKRRIEYEKKMEEEQKNRDILCHKRLKEKYPEGIPTE